MGLSSKFVTANLVRNPERFANALMAITKPPLIAKNIAPTEVKDFNILSPISLIPFSSFVITARINVNALPAKNPPNNKLKNLINLVKVNVVLAPIFCIGANRAP